MARYAAKLLFQFRVETAAGSSGKMRTCEERIVHFDARSPRQAVTTANARGRRAEFGYENGDGNPVRFEFVGLLDVMSFGNEVEADEVWYDIYDRLTPMERRATLLPAEAVLLARLKRMA